MEPALSEDVLLVRTGTLWHVSDMDERLMIEHQLAQAETHVVEVESHLARQRQIVADLEPDGHDDAAQAARELLATFEVTHQSHLEDRDRLRGELAALTDRTRAKAKGK